MLPVTFIHQVYCPVVSVSSVLEMCIIRNSILRQTRYSPVIIAMLFLFNRHQVTCLNDRPLSNKMSNHKSVVSNNYEIVTISIV